MYYYTYIHTYILTSSINTCIHTYIHIYIHTYLHTYIHTYNTLRIILTSRPWEPPPWWSISLWNTAPLSACPSVSTVDHPAPIHTYIHYYIHRNHHIYKQEQTLKVIVWSAPRLNGQTSAPPMQQEPFALAITYIHTYIHTNRSTTYTHTYIHKYIHTYTKLKDYCEQLHHTWIHQSGLYQIFISHTYHILHTYIHTYIHTSLRHANYSVHSTQVSECPLTCDGDVCGDGER